MIAEKRVLDVTSTLEGEKVGMAIHTDALAHIMSVLTDLYSDPELAVIREYSTNALDAHIEAGVTRPIEITLPNSMDPYLRVRDYGLGLDANDIREIYSQYGASTKRQSNEVVGMLGLGCKSALTYTDQFIVAGTKDGICTQVSVSRDEDGTGSMTIVSAETTDQPSGVEIIIPAKRGNYFERKATNFFRFWDEGTVLVNGEAPKRIDGFWVTDDLLLTHEVSEDIVVMGNVPYPSTDSHRRGGYVVSFVNIGDVNFTPSREALQMTAKTKATLETITERFEKELVASINKSIATAPTHWDAVQAAIESTSYGFDFTDAVYQGENIPNLLQGDANGKAKDGWGNEIDTHPDYTIVNQRRHYGDRGGTSIVRAIQTIYLPQSIWFTNFEFKTFTPTMRKKLDVWLKDKNIKVEKYICGVKLPSDSKWIDPATVYNWEDVAAIKLATTPSTTAVSGVPTGSYPAYVNGVSTDILAKDIDTSKPIFWRSRHEHIDASFLAEHNPKGYTAVYLTANRVAKFKRDFPQTMHVSDYYRDKAAKWFKNLTENQKIRILANSNNDYNHIAKLDPAKLDDPKLKKIITVLSTKDNTLKQFRNYSRWFAGDVDMEDFDSLVKYTLLTSLSLYGILEGDFKEHLYLYLNAAYVAEQEKIKNAV